MEATKKETPGVILLALIISILFLIPNFFIALWRAVDEIEARRVNMGVKEDEDPHTRTRSGDLALIENNQLTTGDPGAADYMTARVGENTVLHPEIAANEDATNMTNMGGGGGYAWLTNITSWARGIVEGIKGRMTFEGGYNYAFSAAG